MTFFGGRRVRKPRNLSTMNWYKFYVIKMQIVLSDFVKYLATTYSGYLTCMFTSAEVYAYVRIKYIHIRSKKKSLYIKYNE